MPLWVLGVIAATAAPVLVAPPLSSEDLVMIVSLVVSLPPFAAVLLLRGPPRGLELPTPVLKRARTLPLAADWAAFGAALPLADWPPDSGLALEAVRNALMMGTLTLAAGLILEPAVAWAPSLVVVGATLVFGSRTRNAVSEWWALLLKPGKT